MIKNYLKITLRGLVKNKFYSFINIGGLTIGMAVAALIGLWVYDEWSFNKNFKNYDRIAQVMQNFTMNGETGTGITIPFPIGEELRKSYGSDFKSVSMASWNDSHILSFEDKKLTQSGSFFELQAVEMLSLQMLNGNKDGLKDPSSVLLSAATAKAYFGDGDPINNMMKIDNNLNVKVTGVYKDFPYNSSFANVHFIASWELFASSQGLKNSKDPWRCNCYLSYVQLADNADINKVSAKIEDIKLGKVDKSELMQKPQIFLHPMSRWHLYSEFKNGVNAGGRIQYVWLFGIIGIFILLLACTNFMNLGTARSEKRAKEIGIRKSVGSLRRQLIFQFFSESLMVAVVAFFLSLLLVQLALPYFNEVADKRTVILWTNPVFWMVGIGFSMITGVIAGSYPALYLSSFNPVKVLKDTFKAGRFSAVPRKVSVVVQFTVSVILIIGTIIVFRQVQFAKDRPIGYSRDGLVTAPEITADMHDHFDVVKNELINSGAIKSMAEAGSPTTDIWSTNAGFNWKEKDPRQAVEFPNIDVAQDYGKTIGWQFTRGRDFSKEFLSDSLAFIMNETAVKYTGLKNPVGETITWDGVSYKVIGVIKDMVIESPYVPVRPMLFHLSPYQGNVVIAKVNPAISAHEALGKIEAVFKKYNPVQSFDYKFVDEAYEKKFGNEQRYGKLASFFAVLAIFISCLGLFGMASFVAEQRIKEVGVRKVLDASVFGLWRLLSQQFVLLVLLSCSIAISIAWYFLNDWLQQYEYRTTVSWWIFVIAVMLALLITLLTVSVQAIKAAVANPVRSLRTE